jgi:hypothetical protein
MSISLIKILSCSIFLAQQQNKKILTTLLKDYAKSKVRPNQYIFILLLVVCYEDNNIFRDDRFYQILDKYIYIFGNYLCKYFLYCNGDSGPQILQENSIIL